MKAITVYQPYASFLAVGIKRLETRGWPTAYRGVIAIHASLNSDYDGGLEDQIDAVANMGRRDIIRASGAIIGIATLTDCLPTGSLLGLTELERRLGNFEPDRFAFRMEGAMPLDHPVPCRGKQGIWTIDEEVEKLVRWESVPF